MKRLQQTRILSVLLAVCMLVSLLPVGMMAGALDPDVYNEGNAYYRYNMHIIPTYYRSGYGAQTRYLDQADYTGSIFQMAEGHSAYTPHYDSPYPGFAAAYERDYLTDGSAADDLLSSDPADFATDPWMLAGYNPAAVPAPTVGAGLVASNSDAYITLRVLVPSSGTYTPRVHFYAYGSHASTVNMYVAPIDADDVRDESYLVGTFTGTAKYTSVGAANQFNSLYTIAPIEIAAGEYYITFAANGYLGLGGLELVGSAPVADTLTVAADATGLNNQGQLVLPLDGSASVALTATNNAGAVDLASLPEGAVRVECASDEISASYDAGVLTVSTGSSFSEGLNTSVTVLVTDENAADWVEIPIRIDSPYYYRYNQHLLTIKAQGSSSEYQDVAEIDTLWDMAMGHSEYKPYIVAGGGGAGALWVGPYETDGIDDFYSAKAEDLSTAPYAIIDWSAATTPGVTVGSGIVTGAQSGGGWYSMKILVPTAGTYEAEAQFYGVSAAASAINMYIVKEANYVTGAPLVAANKVGTFTGTNAVPATAISTSAYDALYTLADPITLDAGEYVVTYHSADAKYFYGGSLTLRKAEVCNDLVLTADAAALNADGQLEAPVADSVSIDISAVNNNGAVDLASIEPDYVEIDCGSDAISASYQDGVVTVTASRLDVDPVTNLTLLFVGGDAAAWVEIPVKVVPGTERTLALSYAGAADSVLATIPTTLEISALIDNESTAILSTDSVAVEIVDATGNAATADTAVRIVDGKAYLDLTIPTAGSYTAKVTATIDGVTLASAYEIPLTVSEIGYYYNYMKLSGVVTPGGGSYGWQFQEFMDDYADTWTGGSTDIAPANVSDGWFPGERENAGAWRWTSSAAAYGAYFLESAIGGYNSVNIYLPIGGNYTISSVHSEWSGGGKLDYYLAPKGTANPFADEYKLNTDPVNHNNGTLTEVTIPLTTKDLTAGEYTLYYKSLGNVAGTAISGGYFLKGLKLDYNGNMSGTKSYIDLDTNVKVLTVGASVTVTATTLPTVLNTAISWSSDDQSVATVNNGVIKAVGEGLTKVTVTTADGVSRSFDVLVGKPAYDYKIWTAYYNAFMANGQNYIGAAANTAAGGTYKTTEYDGRDTYDAIYAAKIASDPWTITNSDIGDGTEYSGIMVNDAVKNKAQGVLCAYGTLDTGYVRVKIRVSEDGVYRLVTPIDKGGLHIASSMLYLAPIDAENPVADEYKIGENAAPRMGGKQNTTVLFDQVTLKAGDYYLTATKNPTTQRSNSAKGYDYLTLYDCKLYKMANLSDVGLSTIDGAQIRTVGKQGLRFISKFDKTTVDADKVDHYGSILLPTEDLNTQRDLVIGATYNNHAVAVVPAVNLRAETDEYAEFTVVLTGVPVEYYTSSFTARAYAIMDDGSVVYGDTFSVRSIYEVAKNGLAEGSGATDAEKEVFQQIVDLVDGVAQ